MKLPTKIGLSTAVCTLPFLALIFAGLSGAISSSMALLLFLPAALLAGLAAALTARLAMSSLVRVSAELAQGEAPIASPDDADAIASAIKTLLQKSQQARKSLDVYQERAQHLADSPVLGLLVLDKAGTVTETNDAFARMIGWTRSAIVSRKIKWDDIAPPEYPFFDESIAEKLMKESTHAPWEMEFLHKDGQLVPVLVDIIPLKKDPDKFLCYVLNQSARKQAEDALWESEERFDLFMESLPGVVYIKEADGRLVYVNSTCAKNLGWGPDEWREKKDEDLFPPEVASRFRKIDQSVMDGRKVVESFETIRVDNVERHIILKKFPIFGKSKTPLMLGAIGMDITESKEAEVLLKKQSEELARYNMELEQYSKVLSQDLHDPLKRVNNDLKLIESHYAEKMDKTARSLIDNAITSTMKIYEMIEDLALYSSINQDPSSFQPVDVSEALTAALQNLEPLIKENKAIIQRHPLPTVNGDLGQLTQLMQNIIANALKFRGEAPPTISIQAERQENEWLFSVSDNGVGMDPSSSEHIFVLFHRLNTRGRYAGRGIGLALCKKIVKAHGGRIWATSKASEGSVFYFTLPFKHP